MRSKHALFLGRVATALCALVVFWAATAHGYVEIESNVAELEQYLEKKVTQQLALLFPGMPLVASVKVRLTGANEKIAAAEKAKKNGNPFIDLGYLPFPVDPQEQQGSAGTAGRRYMRIDGTTVHVQADPRVDDETLALVKESVGTILDGYLPVVEIKKIGKDGSNIFSRAHSADFAERSPASEQSSDRTMAFLAQILSALLLAGALAFVGFYVRRAAQTIADGLKNAKGTTTGEGTGSRDSNMDGSLSLGGGSTPFSMKLPLDQAVAYERNLAALRRSLAEKPELIAQELQASPEDADGLRWLLPQIEPKEQETLREWLGPSKTNQMLGLASAASSEGGNDLLEKRLAWLQRFVERVSLRRIRGGSPVDDALGAELSLQASAISVVDVEKWVTSENTAAAWRVAAEFVPAERFARLLEKLEDDQWAVLAAAADANSKDLVAAAKRLVDSKREKDPEAAKRNQRRSDYFQRLLAEPLVVALKRRQLAKQDELLTSLQGDHPDLVASLEARFWSVKQLARVPKDTLRQAFENLSNDDKISLLVSLPEELKQEVRAWLPAGNVKIIVEDRAAKIITRAEPRELATAAETAQRFVDELRAGALAGRFDLIAEGEEEETEQKFKRAS